MTTSEGAGSTPGGFGGAMNTVPPGQSASVNGVPSDLNAPNTLKHFRPGGAWVAISMTEKNGASFSVKIKRAVEPGSERA